MGSQLPADIAARVQAQMASGEFPNADDVLREALEALERRSNRYGNCATWSVKLKRT